jgi:hypothetical protein
MTLTTTERKLLVLALDRAAPVGEIASAGACLIKQLRKRFPTVTAFWRNSTAPMTLRVVNTQP